MSTAGDNAHRKILTLERLLEVREELRAQGKTVVQCHGCFDIVHPGHLRYLRFARQQGDVLIVSVSGDTVVGKGADRPYITEQLRADNLAELEAVDFVCVDHNTWAGPILQAVKPDIYVKGKEYERKGDPRFAQEKAFVESYGGKVIFSSGDVVYSSTNILRRFRGAFGLEHDKVRAYCKRYGIDRAAMATLLKKVRECRLLVMGDPILDFYVHCETLGVASESTILSVTPLAEETFVGGGGLIALQAAALGAKATYLTAIGHDPNLERYHGLLSQAGVKLHVVELDERPVFTKTRYLVDAHKLLKVDRGRPSPLSTVASRALADAVAKVVKDVDGFIVTDFGYGLFSADVVDTVARVAKERAIPYFVDVSQTGSANVLKFIGPRFATPTEQELRFAFGDKESGLSHLASRYLQETAAHRLVITLGKRGVLMFGPTAESVDGRLPVEYLPALTGGIAADPVGAGDTLLSGLALCELAGAPPAHGAYLASAMATLHIESLGNGPVGLEELDTFLDGRDELRQ